MSPDEIRNACMASQIGPEEARDSIHAYCCDCEQYRVDVLDIPATSAVVAAQWLEQHANCRLAYASAWQRLIWTQRSDSKVFDRLQNHVFATGAEWVRLGRIDALADGWFYFEPHPFHDWKLPVAVRPPMLQQMNARGWFPCFEFLNVGYPHTKRGKERLWGIPHFPIAER